MPIVRTYQCAECFHRMEVSMPFEDWDKPPPECPACAMRDQPMQQEFKPPAIVGSIRARATAIAEDIATNDYHVANFQSDRREGGKPKVVYKDQSPAQMASNWQAPQNVLETAIAAGKQMRLKHGSGLDILQAGLKSGTQPDLIAESKKRAIKVW